MTEAKHYMEECNCSFCAKQKAKAKPPQPVEGEERMDHDSEHFPDTLREEEELLMGAQEGDDE
jgi:hypothetical protein